jgi:hypothetical protein
LKTTGVPSGGRCWVRITEELTARIAKGRFNVGRQPHLDPRRHLEEVRHLIADDLRWVSHEHDPVDAAASQSPRHIDLIRFSQHQDRRASAR